MQVDFYFDFGSPTAYLAWHRLIAVCKRNNATINYFPMLLGGIFKATDNRSPAIIPAKGKWLFDDVTRHAKKYDIPFAMNPHFIINTLLPMRGAMWALNSGVIEQWNHAVFEATWVNQRDVSDPVQLAQITNDAGLDSAAMAAAVKQPEIKQQLIDRTNAAVERGVFGAPTMYVNGEMHFGQDRIDWVESAIKTS